ncbi:hypothetical protein GCM10023116_15510 [Kistimonas scapharcae]|uniref:DUF2628 domain-containing protein n=1 Tax=Kistimonas scapharcae TaxID=1036133 RepID=A0ABP8V345_9GAMM
MSESTFEKNTKNTTGLCAKWLEKFDLLSKIGADEKFIFSAVKSPAFKELSFKEKQKVTFNWLAFIFGPFYYFSKRMWLKGSIILGSIWIFSGIFSLIETVLGLSLPSVLLWVIPYVICAQLANYDYYKFITKNEVMWPKMSKVFSNQKGIAGYLVGSFIFLLLTLGAFSSGVPECGSSEATDLVVQIAQDKLKVYGALANNLDMSVKSIRTTSTNEQTGSYQCAADMEVTGVNGTRSFPIKYTIELTDNGDEFYVNVFGL